MRRPIFTLLTLISFLLPSLALASTWTIDPAHSDIGFKIRHMMISNVVGNFEQYTGTVEINEQELSKSTINVTIDTKSINTGITKRDDHLRSADFFDVAQYPTMTFVSRKAEVVGTDQFRITGDLTLHGVTKTVVLAVDGGGTEVKDPWGAIRRGATATTQINRKDFGLAWNALLESGGVLVGDEVKIVLNVELIKK